MLTIAVHSKNALSGILVTPSGITTFVVHGQYVGAGVGNIVGDFVGDNVGFGVGFPAAYVGTDVGDFVGNFVGVGALVGCCADTHWNTSTKSSIAQKSICLSIN